jgi:hypothetical protein
MLEVMRLVCMNEKKSKIMEVAGGQIAVTPEQWSERSTCTVSMHLGYGEKDQAVAKLTQLHQGLAMDPVLQAGYGYPQRLALFHDAAKIAGINISGYLLPPQQVQPPQPDPIKMMTAQAALLSAQASMKTATANESKDQRLAAVDAAKINQGQQDLAIKAMDHDRTHSRQDLETSAKINVAQREMALEEKMRPEELKGVVAPNP